MCDQNEFYPWFCRTAVPLVQDTVFLYDGAPCTMHHASDCIGVKRLHYTRLLRREQCPLESPKVPVHQLPSPKRRRVSGEDFFFCPSKTTMAFVCVSFFFFFFSFLFFSTGRMLLQTGCRSRRGVEVCAVPWAHTEGDLPWALWCCHGAATKAGSSPPFDLPEMMRRCSSGGTPSPVDRCEHRL